MASTPEKILLPGFGRPIDFVPDNEGEELFPTILNKMDLNYRRTAMAPLTLRELEMLWFMNTITDKPQWYTKINDDEIANKWKSEAISTGDDMSQNMADYCIDELRHEASKHTDDSQPPIVVFPGNVVKSDTAVSQETRITLQKAVEAFEASIPEELRHWHPGSKETMLNLVDPSFFPLVYGESHVLAQGQTTTLNDCIDRCCEGNKIGKQTIEDNESFYSEKFQWLPCEVDISGETAKITSYINNLHPKESGLYGLVEKLIDASVPLWNLSLAPLQDNGFETEDDRRIIYTDVEYDPDPASLPLSEGLQRKKGESKAEYSERRKDWVNSMAKLVYPEPGDFADFECRVLDLKGKYGSRGLQVIVQLANIELTPEKPNYKGGSWHAEGQLNEHIVATSLYYYSCENINLSTISFRHQLNTERLRGEIEYDPDGNADWLDFIFGCNYETSAIQETGDILIREGRLLTFPNVLQQCIDPFSLADPTKPGHRKVIALYLVDPHIKIISTAHVPCQQQEWWWEKAMGTGPVQKPAALQRMGSPAISKIPIELQDSILESVKFPFSIEKAKVLRHKFMKERRELAWKSSGMFEDHYISLHRE